MFMVYRLHESEIQRVAANFEPHSYLASCIRDFEADRDPAVVQSVSLLYTTVEM